MQTFDILDPKVDLFGAKILEASAGTGKTFAIEHLVLRLLLESPLLIEEILAITYTRAAAREMRLRIRSSLANALAALQKGESEWAYLSLHFGSKEAIRRLEDAFLGFESAQIFTIHGFCQRMLSEFALEARCLQPGPEETAPLGKAVRGDLLDFLEAQETVGPEQMQELLKKTKMPRLCKDLLNKPLPASSLGAFKDDCSAIVEKILSCPIRNGDLQEEFAQIESACKYTGFDKGDLAKEREALQDLLRDPSSLPALRRLFYWRGSLFRFLSPDNRKKGKEGLPLPPLLDWCHRHLPPLLEASMDRVRLFQRLRLAWQQPFEKILEEKGLFSPDFLLERMKRALVYPDFVAKIQSRFKAVIVDEFQDTDRVQWEIFSSLFGAAPLFYLVGDPKQSIYRFRNADLYTYYRARESLGAEACYSLDTNYRSSPKLVGALNDLFGERHAKPWLWLPGENRTEPFRPVKAGRDKSWDPGDGKQPLQFFKAPNLKDAAYAFIAGEIQRLRPHLPGFASFAILVQSNQQAALLQDYLQKRSLPCSAKSRASLGESLAMEALEELFEAVFFPRDSNAVKRFLAGTLVGAPVLELPDLPQLFFWKSTLDRKGLAAFFREFLSCRWDGGPSFYEKIAGAGAPFFRDFFQLLERFLSEKPHSYEAIVRIFREIEEADPEEDASARRRLDAGEDAIQILTMHTSKGLEFDVVFALGAATPTPASADDPEEAEAEKLRQLYVALTRAKLRLYIPLVEKHKSGVSPLDLLWQRSKLAGDGRAAVEKLIELNPDIGLDPEIEPVLCPPFAAEKKVSLAAPEPLFFPKPAGSIYSYSALAPHGRGEPLAAIGTGKSVHTFPRGSESGTVFHKIFERMFTEERDVREIVKEEILFSGLSEWEEVVLETVQKTLTLPLIDGATLLDLERKHMRAEVEFFFHEPPHFLKGCIDLLFLWKGRLYFLDWKTNWLGESAESYSEEHLRKAMDEHHYWLQASLYGEAIRRAYPNLILGGAIYLFLRGGVLFFEPEPFRLPR